MTTHTCPDCAGQGLISGIACGPKGGNWRTTRCTMCEGTGQVSPERLAKAEAGRRMRDERRARGITQRERAAELGMDVVAYSQLENGRD